MPNSFSPSELVLLLGERFAGAGSFTQGKEELLTGAATVSQNELAREVLTVALLAMEQAGEIRIINEKRKALLGLTTREALVVEATGSRAAWPAGSLESELRDTIAAFRAEVYDVVYRWFGNDMDSPERHLLDRVKRGLVGRGLVQREEKRTLKIFVSHDDTLPDATRSLLAAESPDALLGLLRAPGRAEVVELIRKQVTKALNRRTEDDD
jgi:hypothetical protein